MVALFGAMDQPPASSNNNSNNLYEPEILHSLGDVFLPIWILFSFCWNHLLIASQNLLQYPFILRS